MKYENVMYLGLDTDPEIANPKDLDKSIIWKGVFPMFIVPESEYEEYYCKPRYQPGEVVYLKEPYKIGFDDHLPYYKYLTDIKLPAGIDRWENKLFMPAKYARYFIRIKDVRVENVGDISNDDAICEGFNSKENFINTFTKINKLKIWDRPWVFAYTFELTEKPESLTTQY